jgi:hypothetical protein
MLVFSVLIWAGLHFFVYNAMHLLSGERWLRTGVGVEEHCDSIL